MSKEFRSVTFSFTVKDPEDLPGDWYADDVIEEIERVLSTRLAEWYEARGHALLACDPT